MPSLHQYDGTGSCAFSIAILHQEGTLIEAAELLAITQAVCQLDANKLYIECTKNCTPNYVPLQPVAPQAVNYPSSR